MKARHQLLFGFLLALLLGAATSYQTTHNSRSTAPVSEARRTFLTTATAALLAGSFPRPALAADIKVTTLAHTFITSSGAAKPIRENDATRFFTNARVVYLFEGQGASSGLAPEVLDLTRKRKVGEGSGVTPGNVQSCKAQSPDAVAAVAKAMPDGDVLLVGPIPSSGTAADGKILADTAKALDTFVGGKTGRGVISVLLDGPREGLKLEESGYPASELLWYSLPSKS